jgi:flagellar hook-basal body complex protein FliE
MAVNNITGMNFLSLSKDSLLGKKEDTVNTSFMDFLKTEVQKTDVMIKESDLISEAFAAGNTDNLHQVLLAAEKASISLQYIMQIRNKVMDAYNEIMRMQI